MDESKRKMSVVWVTGASSGFGYAIANLFSSRGFKVIATARRLDRLVELSKGNSNIFPYALDVKSDSNVKTFFEALPSELKDVSILVNNAGLALGMESASKASLDDWNEMVDVNIRGVLHCTHAVLPGMVSRNEGQIINIGSIAGEFPYPGGNVYGATKAFLHQFSLNLRADLLGTKVRITCLEPGMCGGTEFSNVRFKGDLEKAKSVYDGVEYLSPKDISETVWWIATLPNHINVNVLSMMPVQQAFSPLAIHRTK